MLVTERMRSLGDHAKSSRQPPVKERKRAKADASAAKTVDIDEDIFDDGTAQESAAAVIVDNAASQIVVDENGNDAQAAGADDSATQAKADQEEDDSAAAKRAIIHEWENWSALHSDELNDPNVAEYFFRHLETNKADLLDFRSSSKRQFVLEWLPKKAAAI